MRKFLEKLETDDNKYLLKTLFHDLWCEKILTSTSVTVTYPNTTPVFVILAYITQNITNNSYDDFNELFIFLKKTKVSFSFGDKQLSISINNIDDFIQSMKNEDKSLIKKFNI